MICLDSLRRLEAELGDDSLSRTFVDSYVSMWESRHSRLRDAVLAPDLEAGMDAALSLKASSAMAGAHCLSHLASRLEELLTEQAKLPIPEPRPAGAPDLLRQIRLCGAATMERLRQDYLDT